MGKIEDLEREMNDAVRSENYEEAAKLRDIIQSVVDGTFKEPTVVRTDKPHFSVSADDLEAWSMDNGEDVIMDGPFVWTSPQWDTLGIDIKISLSREFGLPINGEDGEDPIDWYEHVWDSIHENNVDADEAMYHMLEIVAQFITENQIHTFNGEIVGTIIESEILKIVDHLSDEMFESEIETEEEFMEEYNLSGDIHLSKSEDWGEHHGDGWDKFMFNCGPSTEGGGPSDSIYMNAYVDRKCIELGINCDVGIAENLHLFITENDDEANGWFKELGRVIREDGFRIDN